MQLYLKAILCVLALQAIDIAVVGNYQPDKIDFGDPTPNISCVASAEQMTAILNTQACQQTIKEALSPEDGRTVIRVHVIVNGKDDDTGRWFLTWSYFFQDIAPYAVTWLASWMAHPLTKDAYFTIPEMCPNVSESEADMILATGLLNADSINGNHQENTVLCKIIRNKNYQDQHWCWEQFGGTKNYTGMTPASQGTLISAGLVGIFLGITLFLCTYVPITELLEKKRPQYIGVVAATYIPILGEVISMLFVQLTYFNHHHRNWHGLIVGYLPIAGVFLLISISHLISFSNCTRKRDYQPIPPTPNTEEQETVLCHWKLDILQWPVRLLSCITVCHAVAWLVIGLVADKEWSVKLVTTALGAGVAVTAAVLRVWELWKVANDQSQNSKRHCGRALLTAIVISITLSAISIMVMIWFGATYIQHTAFSVILKTANLVVGLVSQKLTKLAAKKAKPSEEEDNVIRRVLGAPAKTENTNMEPQQPPQSTAAH